VASITDLTFLNFNKIHFNATRFVMDNNFSLSHSLAEICIEHNYLIKVNIFAARID
jgi:hypothetical protein